MTVCAQRENPISYGFNTVIAENQTQSLILQLGKIHANWAPSLAGCLFLFILKFIFNLGKIVL